MISHRKIVSFLILFLIDLVCADLGDIIEYISFSIFGLVFLVFVVILCTFIIKICLGHNLNSGGWQTHEGKFNLLILFNRFKFK